MSVISEIDSIITLLESQIPANPNSRKNLLKRKRLERELAKYFDRLERAFPYSKLAGIYNRYVRESIGSESANILDPLLATFSEPLESTIEGQLAEVYISGQAEMISYGKTKMGIPIAYEGPPISQAIDWAEKHGATLIKGMDEETKRRLAHTISQGIEQKRGIPGLARDIKKEFADMSRYRSKLIARTETANALSTASLDNMKGMGIEGKEWITAGDELVSDECEANEAEGVIPVNQEFSGGVMAPPQHPDCLLPDNEVLALGLVAMSRAFYSGQVVELLTRSGNKLTITSNHPILTPLGFVSAEMLNEGDYIICCPDSERMVSAINPYYDYIPTAIEKIWKSLSFSSGVSNMSMEIAPIDFHGDARFFYGDVNIINSNRFLRGDISDAFNSEHISKKEFSLGSTDAPSFPRLGFSFPFGNGGSPAPNGFVSSGYPCHSLSGRHQRHTNSVGLATIPRHDTNIKQSFANNISAYANLSSQFLLRFSNLIMADELVKVRNFDYSGHVYNLQSIEQLYISNNIIVKNCRCTISPARLTR